MQTNVSRRNFLKKSSLATAAAAAAAVTPGMVGLFPKTAAAAYSPLNKWPGRCVINYNSQHTCMEMRSSDAVTDLGKIRAVVDQSIKLLTGKSTVGEAWKSIFPDSGPNALTLTSKIAIKINILAPDCPPHPFAVSGIVEGLKQMQINGTAFPVGNIIIYDANNWGTFAGAGYGNPGAGNWIFPNVNFVHHGTGGAGCLLATNGALGQNYTKTLADCQFLINVPGMRGHSGAPGGATLGFKSHYGTYAPKHGDMDNYLRDINCTGPVFEKTVLTVCAALYAAELGCGPEWYGGNNSNYLPYAQTMVPGTTNTKPNTILMSTDPVTLEFQALSMMWINGTPTSRKFPSRVLTPNDAPSYLKMSAGINGIGTTYNIGIIDPALMDVRRIVNGVTSTTIRNSVSTGKDTFHDLTVYPNESHTAVTFKFAAVPQSPVHLTITDIQGRAIWSGKDLSAAAITWTGVDAANRRVPAGVYLYTLQAGDRLTQGKMQILR